MTQLKTMDLADQVRALLIKGEFFNLLFVYQLDIQSNFSKTYTTTECTKTKTKIGMEGSCGGQCLSYCLQSGKMYQ